MRWLFALLLIPCLARADAVVLSNHTSYVGRVLKETPEEVTIVSDGITWSLKRDKIAAVTHDAKEADREEAEAARHNAEAAAEAARKKQLEAQKRKARQQAAASGGAHRGGHHHRR